MLQERRRLTMEAHSGFSPLLMQRGSQKYYYALYRMRRRYASQGCMITDNNDHKKIGGKDMGGNGGI